MMQPQFKLKAQAGAAAAFMGRRQGRRSEIEGMDLITPLDSSQVVDLSLIQWSALQALRAGSATEADYCHLAVGANVSMVLCERGVLADRLPDVLDAQDALVRMRARANRTGRYVADGPGLQAITRFVELHEEQLAPGNCTQAQVLSAVQEVQNRRAAGQVIEVRA